MRITLFVLAFAAAFAAGTSIQYVLHRPSVPRSYYVRPLERPLATKEPLSPSYDGWRIVSIRHTSVPLPPEYQLPTATAPKVVQAMPPQIVRKPRPILGDTRMHAPPSINSYEHNYDGNGKGRF